GEHWTLQLKGSGLTPYSRTADGLAVLRSSIREFLCSEAMYYLGIPTTRALSIITTGEQVVRDMFYDGHPKKEAGAVVCRLAQSFIRFGNFQLMADRNGIPLLKQLVDFTIKNDFPHIEQLRTASNEKEIYLQWFNEVCTRTCSMIMHWMRVGFVHGVMNTDNMSITGLTIDYGPYGWLEGFEPDWTPNTTDATHHRYAFAKQPQIAQWNLLQLANAILPLVDEVVPFEKILQNTSTLFDFKWHEMMLKKIGIVNYDQILHKNKEHEDLLQQLIQVLCCREIDMTLFFRQLAEVNLATADFSTQQDTDKAIDILSDSFYKSSPLNKKQFIIFQNWLKLYQIKIKQEPQTHQQKKQQMNQTNPLYVLRNYLAQQAIEKAEKGDYAEINTLLNLLKNPYEAQPGMERYQQKRPEWARHKAGCSMLSCSS
ncbi:MAG TPA: YdiU family protein, partial [Aeromonadales bacterium]|nr:YdiU family protein [Aeromonadales bacterium]